MKIWVEGEPATFLTRREKEWRVRIREGIGNFKVPSNHGIVLRFVVSSWRRRGHHFDVDNLGKPILDELGRPKCTFVEAELRVGQVPGAEIAVAQAPSMEVERSLWLRDLPRKSVRRPDADPALVETAAIGRGHSVRAHLEVHEDDNLTNFDFTGFVKPTLDRLWPILGGSALRPEDHRIHHLIVTRSTHRPSGISIGIEVMNE
jgi:hypothetical protein